MSLQTRSVDIRISLYHFYIATCLSWDDLFIVKFETDDYHEWHL